MTSKELWVEVNAEQELLKLGYTKLKCDACDGKGLVKMDSGKAKCYHCEGQGFFWKTPAHYKPQAI